MDKVDPPFADVLDAPRTYIEPAPFSAVSFSVRCLIMLVASACAGAVGIWLNEWVGMALGGVAIFCLGLPIAAWREARDEWTIKAEANSLMRAHSRATVFFLQQRLDRAHAWLQEERDKDREFISALEAERDELKSRIPARGEKGRWISRKSFAKLLPSPKQITTIEDP